MIKLNNATREQVEFGLRSLEILEKQKGIFKFNHVDIQMDKIERAFTKIQQMLRDRKTELKKFYNNSYQHEK